MSLDQKSRLLSPPTPMKSWSSPDFLPLSYQLHMPVAEYLCQTCGLRIRKEHWVTHAQVHELISRLPHFLNPISAPPVSPPTSISKLNLPSSSSQMVSSKPYSHSLWPPSLSVDYAHFLQSQLGTSPLPEKMSKSPPSPTSLHPVPSMASNTDLSSAFSILKHHTNALSVLTSDYGSPQLESRRTSFVTTSDAQIAMQKLLQIQNHRGPPSTSSPLSSRSEVEDKIGLRQPKRSRCENGIDVDRKKRWRCELFPPVLHSRYSANQSLFHSFVEPRLFIKTEPTHASNVASPAPILTSTPVSHDPFVCPDCGKGFTRNSNLTRHRRIHSGEKRFGCGDCKKHFMEKHHLIAHIRTHTGERPFQCRACGRRFTDRSNMLRHLRTHSHMSGRMSGPELLLECGGSDDEFGTMPRPKDMNVGAGNLPGTAHDQDSGDEDSEDEITRATFPSTTLPTRILNSEIRQTDDVETTPPLGPTKGRIRFDLPPKDLFPSSSPASLLEEKSFQESSSSTDSKTLSTSCNSGLTPIMRAMDINRIHTRNSNESGDSTPNESKVKTIEDELVCNSEPPAFTLPPTRKDNLEKTVEIDQKSETIKSRKQSPRIGDFEKSLQDVLEGFSLLQEPPQSQLSLSSTNSDVNPPRLSLFSNSQSHKSDPDDAMEKKRLFSEENHGGLDAIAACAAAELQALHLRPPLSLPPLKQKRKQEQQKIRSKSIPDKTKPKTKSNKPSPKKIPEQLRRSRSSSVKNQKKSQ